MSIFTLDTSGEVTILRPNFWGDGDRVVRWSDLSPFAQGYVEALFASLPFFHMECPACEWDCIVGPPGLGDLGICCPLCAEDNGRTVTVRTEARVSRDWTGTVEGSDDRKKGFSDLSPEALALILRDCTRALETKLWGDSVGDGRLFWSERQEELFSGFWGGQQTLLCETLFPPLAVTLSDDGKVCLKEAGQ